MVIKRYSLALLFVSMPLFSMNGQGDTQYAQHITPFAQQILLKMNNSWELRGRLTILEKQQERPELFNMIISQGIKEQLDNYRALANQKLNETHAITTAVFARSVVTFDKAENHKAIEQVTKLLDEAKKDIECAEKLIKQSTHPKAKL